MNNPKSTKNPDFEYQLIDSGNLKKLERFGETILIRPCSQAIWTPSKEKSIWTKASAEFDHDLGWKNFKPLDKWSMKISADKKIILRLQENGQIGIFPEHHSYLEDIKKFIGNNENIRILNLFAYTGMASVFLSEPKLEITHVDITKKCLDWTRENLNTNSHLGSVRLINEDAEEFLKKEIRRNKTYNVIIIDPPSFSRLSRSKSWNLEDILPDLVSLLVRTVDQNKFAIFFASHLQQGFANTISNLFWDHFKDSATYQQRLLNLVETESSRELPCSNLSIITRI